MNIKDLNIEVYNQNTNELWYLIDIDCNNNQVCLHIITKNNITKQLIYNYNICQFYKCIHNNYIWNNVFAVLFTTPINTRINYKDLNNILMYLDYKFPMYLI